MPEDLPILYSFRRCPYAMRARLAVRASGQVCALREIVLKDKAPEFRAASAKATVPVLVDGTGTYRTGPEKNRPTETRKTHPTQ